MSSGATSGQAIFQGSGLNSNSGIQITFSVWLKAAANTAVTLRINSNGVDAEDDPITVTNAWQRFTFTHSGTWTGVRQVFAIIVMPINSSIFAWGAQMEDGAVASLYRQTTNATSGVTSGNGFNGTPETRFSARAPIVNNEQHQNAIGQRGLNLAPTFRVSPLTLDMGNNTDERVRRLLNFRSARNLGLPTTPYVAPWSGKVTCFMDAVDVQARALISQLCGDIITVDSTVTEEYQGDYEIKQAIYILPGTDTSNSSGAQPNAATIELTLLQYLSAAFSDVSLVGQPVRASIPRALLPIAAVDSSGIQRLKGTFTNNPTNVGCVFTSGSPLAQSGTSTTILIAAFTAQFGDGQVSYNSGSVNPGSYGTYFIYLRDPQYLGGTVTYFATTARSDLTKFNDIVVVGQVTTALGGGGFGTGGGSGACFSGNTGFRVPNGTMKFKDAPGRLEITTLAGPRWARLKRSGYSGWMHDMGNEELVTPGHLIKVTDVSWSPASRLWPVMEEFEGDVFTLEVETEFDDERHFILENGSVAHNLSTL
ncbi:MAG: hypothetical protein WA738_03810 [Candidatus Angelobacter sp.]